MLVRRVRRALSLLLVAALALSLAACTGDTEDAPPPPVTTTATAIATPAATPIATPAATPSPTPTPTATPAPTPTATPTATPTPAPVSAPSPTPSPTATPSPMPQPSPTLTPMPTSKPLTATVPLLTRADLGIREVDLAEVMAAGQITRAFYGASEQLPGGGLYFLDIGTGMVEYWGHGLARVSADHRVVLTENARHDRLTGITHEWEPWLDGWWESRDGERLLFGLHREETEVYVLVDSSMHPVGQIALALDPEYGRWDDRRWDTERGDLFVFTRFGTGLDKKAGSRHVVADRLLRPLAELDVAPQSLPLFVPHPSGRHIFSAGDGFLHLFDLAGGDGALIEPAFTWSLPVRSQQVPTPGLEGLRSVQYRSNGDGLTVVGPRASGCGVLRYGLDGAVRSNVSIGCLWFFEPVHDPQISPDGTLVTAVTAVATHERPLGSLLGMATSVFDAESGEELLRVRGVHGSGYWLADGSGVEFRTNLGRRTVTLEGRWSWRTVRQVKEIGDVAFSELGDVVVTGPAKEAIAALELRFDLVPLPGIPYLTWSWSEARNELGARLGGGGHAPGPLAPPPLSPVIELPPFDDRLLVEVVVDTCLNAREEPSLDAPIVGCLSDGAVAETDDFQGDWMHLRTADGLEGWAHADYLRWHSDGVRLEE